MSYNNNLDMFGRDLSLKKPLFSDYVARFKGMSWADINFLIEDEEEMKEAKRKQADRKELCKIHEERKQLYAQGLYELEEGEELDYP